MKGKCEDCAKIKTCKEVVGIIFGFSNTGFQPKKGDMPQMKYRNLEDRCPLCGSPVLNYGSFELHDTSVEYPTECRSCGATWVQWYDFVYAGNTDVMDKDGKEID